MSQAKRKIHTSLSKRAKAKRLRSLRAIKIVPPDRMRLIEAMWIPSGLPHYR